LIQARRRRERVALAGLDGAHITAGDVMRRQNPAILDQLAQSN
jgi:hypothetical protein